MGRSAAVRALRRRAAFLTWPRPRRRAGEDETTRVHSILRTSWLWLTCLLLAACGGFEMKRVRELQRDKGFGTRAQGDASVENYLAGGDLVVFILSPSVYQQPFHEKLFLLTQAQPVGIDGTILIPYVGAVPVLGMTESGLTQMVKDLLRPVFNDEIDVQARIQNKGKVFYAFGEVGGLHAIPIEKADMTILDTVARLPYTQLANLGRVFLIKPDAENPLVMVVNIREMVHTGLTTSNFPVRENDIIYIPPTFLGSIARILERLLQPISIGVNALLGIARVRASYDYLTGRDQFGGYFFRF